jgi:hypothetical protein
MRGKATGSMRAIRRIAAPVAIRKVNEGREAADYVMSSGTISPKG